IMFKAQPKTELTKFINAYKSASSRLIKLDFPRVKQFLWKEMFWSKSFCLLTTGGAPIDVIKKYIQNQGNNHKSKVGELYGTTKSMQIQNLSNRGTRNLLCQIFWLCP
ncbi:IS200/IS605 family transposase, partial [Enterococcus faecium]|uniref:IS200/IS605 family transposase n=1 Tax=Enterococcus faecium TaxID=1352 RepID=UPI00211A91EE